MSIETLKQIASLNLTDMMEVVCNPHATAETAAQLEALGRGSWPMDVAADARRLGLKAAKAANAAAYLPKPIIEIASKPATGPDADEDTFTYSVTVQELMAPNSLLFEEMNRRGLLEEDSAPPTIQVVPVDQDAKSYPLFLIQPLLQDGYLCIGRRKLWSKNAVANVFCPLFSGDDQQYLPYPSINTDGDLPTYDSKQGVVDGRAYSASLGAALVPGSYMPDTVAIVTCNGRKVNGTFKPYGSDGRASVHPSILHKVNQYRGINLDIGLLAKGLLVPDELSYVEKVEKVVQVTKSWWNGSAMVTEVDHSQTSTSSVCHHGMTGGEVDGIDPSWQCIYEGEPTVEVLEVESLAASEHVEPTGRLKSVTKVITTKSRYAVVTLDHLSIKARWKGHFKAERKSNILGCTKVTLSIGSLRQWTKTGSSRGCFEFTEKVKVNAESKAIMQRLIRRQYDNIAAAGTDALIDAAVSSSRDDQFMVAACRKVGVSPETLPNIADLLNDRLGKDLWTAAQGLGLKLPTKVAIIDDTMDDAAEVAIHRSAPVVGVKHNGKWHKMVMRPKAVMVSRYPLITDSGIQVRKNHTGYKHQMVRSYKPVCYLEVLKGEEYELVKTLPAGTLSNGTFTQGQLKFRVSHAVERSVAALPKESAYASTPTFVGLQGDDDGDTLLISSDFDVLELAVNHIKRLKRTA